MRNVKFLKIELNTLKNYDWIKCFTFFTIFFSLLFCLISFYDTYLYENLFLSYIEILTFAIIGYFLFHGDYFRNRCYYTYLIFPCWIIISHWLKTEFVLLQSDQVTFVLRCLICGIALPFAHLMKDTAKRKYLDFFAFIIILTIAIILCLCYWGFLRGENITLLNGCFEFGVIYNRTGRVMLNAINLHYYHLGYLSVVCFFMTLYLTISYWSYKVAPFGIFLLLLFASGVILTYSRTGVIALLIGIFLAIAIFFQYIPLNKYIRLFLLSIIIIFGCVSMGIIMNHIYSAVHSIRNIWYGIATLSSRTTIWGAAIEVFHDYPSHLIHGFPTDEIIPLINSYLPELDIVVHMHSGYLQTLMSIGLPGLIGVLAFCAYILFCSAKLLFALPSQNILISDKMLTLIPIVCMAMNIVESVIFYNVVATEILNIVFALFSGYLIEKTYSITRIGPSF